MSFASSELVDACLRLADLPDRDVFAPSRFGSVGATSSLSARPRDVRRHARHVPRATLGRAEYVAACTLCGLPQSVWPPASGSVRCAISPLGLRRDKVGGSTILTHLGRRLAMIVIWLQLMPVVTAPRALAFLRI